MAGIPESGCQWARGVLGVDASASFAAIERAYLEQVARAHQAFLQLGGFAFSPPAHHTFDTFVVGPCNQMAISACQRLVEEACVDANPLYLYGKPGHGKTHLLANVWRALREHRPEALVMVTSGERFTNDLMKAMQDHSLELFRTRYRQVDFLLVDGIQFMSRRFHTQEEFQLILDHLTSLGRPVLITGMGPVGDLDGFSDALRSRLTAGLIVEVAAPDLETRKGIVRQFAARAGLDLSRDVIFKLAQRIDTDVRALAGAVGKLAACHRLRPNAWETESVDDLLHDLSLSALGEELTLDEVVEHVSDHFGLDATSLREERGNRTTVKKARQVAMYLCRTLTRHSLQEIADVFGASAKQVTYAVRTVKEKLEDPVTSRDIERLRGRLDQREANNCRKMLDPLGRGRG